MGEETPVDLSTGYESPPGPPHRGLCPRTAALRLSLLGAGFARLPPLEEWTTRRIQAATTLTPGDIDNPVPDDLG